MTLTSLLSDFDLSLDDAKAAVSAATKGADDGELFLERNRAESLMLDNGELKQASYHDHQGFGLRAVAGESVGYAQSNEVSAEALKRASASVSAVTRGHDGRLDLSPARTNQRIYEPFDPIASPSLPEKIALLGELDQYARAADPRVVQVSASLSTSFQAVEIIRPDGEQFFDARPLVRFNVSVIVEQDGRRERGSFGAGGRLELSNWIGEEAWKYGVKTALEQALINLESVPGPAGEQDVVLGSGWAGILLHEAIGHGLEGDFNRKGSSAFSGKIGERVAAPGVTVVDDGTIEGRRGSIQFDDEGTPSARNVLIEDGILKGYLQDRQNGRLMGSRSSGNGRRQSFAHVPMPRMTNTFMENGAYDPEEIIASVDRGIYAKGFGGGQVDITSGKFVFECTEAYVIEKGKLGKPIKSATLVGHGPDILTRVSMIGNDFALDPGVGTCGKEGQGVPVGVGQPSLRVNRMTVGGSA